jgi:hypothetical protein
MRRNGKGSSLGRSGPRQNQRELEVAVTGHSRMRVEASSLRLRNPWVLLLEKISLLIKKNRETRSLARLRTTCIAKYESRLKAIARLRRTVRPTQEMILLAS